MKRLAIASSLALSTLLASGAVSAQAKSASSSVGKIDTDNDGTVDLNEIKASVGNLFTSLEKDSDGTLDAKELRGKISKRDFKRADPDTDGTVSRDELMSYVESLFKASDTDNDGTVDDKELKSKKGQPLLRLVR
jgi:Ca2+-binding EF-hand superfamily protein